MNVDPAVLVILGPAPCRGCGESVLYGRSVGLRGRTGKLPRWRDPDTARPHLCRCRMDAPGGTCVRVVGHAGDCRPRWHERHGKHAA